jgi:hypothetical protein
MLVVFMTSEQQRTLETLKMVKNETKNEEDNFGGHFPI